MANDEKAAASRRARINFAVDALIAVAFVLVAVSGIVLFAAGDSGGYRGGRNPAALRDLLFMSRTAWRDLHDWSGIAMMAGVLGHLALHARWMLCMTRNLMRRTSRRRNVALSCPADVGQA